MYQLLVPGLLALAPALAMAAPAQDASGIAALFQADQAERAGMATQTSREDMKAYAADLARHDTERRAQVLSLLRSGQLHTADDYYQAAMIMQHGQSSQDYDLAHALATLAKTLATDDSRARWLAAATADRWLLSRQPQQWYGTQPVCHVSQGQTRCELNVLEAAVSDQERQAAGIAPLDALREQARQREQTLRQQLQPH
jgi:hypothetical protein